MNGIAKPARNGADSGNATHQLVACAFGDELSGTLHIWPPTWLLLQSSLGRWAAVPDRP